MAASIGKVNVDVVANVPESVLRLRALELAVEARGTSVFHSAGATIEDAEAYLAFLTGGES